jgi:hypothetical protein
MASKLSDEEKTALVAVLSLAESHQIWNANITMNPVFNEFISQQYAAIVGVREFLKQHGVLTIHELTQRAAAARQEGEPIQ